MSDLTDEEMLSLTRPGSSMAMFLGDEQKTGWEPYRSVGITNPGPGSFFADSIRVRSADEYTVASFGFNEGGRRLVYAGLQCYVNWP